MSKKLIFPIFIYFILYLVLTPKLCISTTSDTLLLWYQSVLPALFPALLLVNILFKSVDLKFSVNIIYYVLGLLCGFPIGCILICNLVKKEKLSIEKGQFFAAAVNQFSPAFLSSYLAIQILHKNAILVIAVLYISQSVGYFLLYFLVVKSREKEENQINKPKPISKVESHKSNPVSESIMDSVETLVKIGGYMIICTNILQSVSQLQFIKKYTILIAPFVEVSSGLNLLKNTNFFQIDLLPVAMAASSFGGLCGYLQVKSILIEANLNSKAYLIYKVIGSISAGILSYVICRFLI